MKKARKLLSAMLGVALALAQVPASVVTAAWMPDHQIPAYQQKDIFATDTVKIQGLTVSEVVNATANPVITRSIDKEVKFVVFNSTKQVIEQEVTSKDGKLPDLNLVRNHNYIIWAEDSEYRMPNVYVWVKDGRLVDIKKNVDTGNYPEVDSLELYKRDQTVENPAEEQRIRSNIEVYSPYGGALYNVKFKLVSNVETLEYSTGNSGKLTVDLLEDVIYMVTVDNPNYTVDSFPVVVKDKSEYGAGKYTYDFSSCAKVDDIKLMNKKDAHKYDTVLTNTDYDTVYAGIYENIAGNTTITGMNFKDFLVLDRKLDKNTVQGMDGKDYDVFDIKVVNPHRWEIAYIAAGDYKVTEKLDNAKTVKNVYYVDDSRALQPVSFAQDGSNVTFSMNTLSMYPVVVEYGSQEVEADNTVLKVKVVDEKGNPVSGVKLYLKSQEYGTRGDLTIDDVTDASGKLGYHCTGEELNDDTYELMPTSDSGYECITSHEIVFDEDDEMHVDTVDDKVYQGEEVELVVKKIGGSEPEEPKPEIDKTTLNIKVVNEKQKPVSDLQLSIKEGDSITPLAVVTDASGNVSYVSESAGTFTIQPDEESGYTCAAPIEIVTTQNENGQGFYIQKVNGQDFDGKDATLVVNKVETMVNEVQVSDSEIGSEGGEVTVTVRGTALPDKMYYAIYYIKQGVHGEEERVAVEAQEVETQGSSTEKTMKITLPKAEQYSGVLRWRVGVTDTNPEEGYYFASQQISIKAETPEPEKPGSDDKGDSKDDNKKDNQDDKGNNNQGNNQGDNGSNKADKGNANKDGGKDKNPQTGDSSTALPLSVSLIASFMVVCAIVLKKRNYKK